MISNAEFVREMIEATASGAIEWLSAQHCFWTMIEQNRSHNQRAASWTIAIAVQPEHDTCRMKIETYCNHLRTIDGPEVDKLFAIIKKQHQDQDSQRRTEDLDDLIAEVRAKMQNHAERKYDAKDAAN